MRKLLGLVVVFAIFVATYAMLKPEAAPTVTATPGAAKPDDKDLPASSVLRINPKGAHAAPTAGTPVKSSPIVSADITQLRQRKAWGELHSRVSSGPQTPEALYIQAEIYSRCAKRPPPADSVNPAASQAEARERFIARLKGDKNAEQRIAAYEKTKLDPCEGVAMGEFSKERLAQLLDAAASAGDPRAQAWQLSQQIERPFFEGQPHPRGYSVTDEQMESIRRLLASGDADVVTDLQGILSSTLIDANLRIGPDGERIDSNAMAAALTLVACDLGAACGADTQRLLMQCAMQGYCGAANLYDYTYFYESSPHQAQLMEQYRQALLEMARNRDFSGLRIAREPSTPGTMFIRGRQRGP